MANKALRAVVDDGTREIPLVNKFGKLICNVYMRPADVFSILARYETLMKDLPEIVKPLEDLSIKNDGTADYEDGMTAIRKAEEELKRRINELFDMEEADDIFAKRNAFSSVGGEFFCTRILTALGGVIEQAVKEETALSEKRMAKYLRDQEQVNADAGTAAANTGN